MSKNTAVRDGFEAQRKAGINVDWFTWQIAWHDAAFTLCDNVSRFAADERRAFVNDRQKQILCAARDYLDFHTVDANGERSGARKVAEQIDEWINSPAADESAKPVGEVILFGSDLKEVSWRNGKMPTVGTKLYDESAPVASKEAVTLSELSVERRAELFDHMLAVAQANGFESITAAIAQAVKAPESFDVIDKQISYVAKLARRDGAAGEKTGQFDIEFERLRTMVRAALAQRGASKAEGQS